MIEHPGILLLDKDPGMSSAQALKKLQHKLGIKKIGHGGTLDPAATGLLVVFLNGATRLSGLSLAHEKTYSGVIHLGVRSNTDDLDGEIISQTDVIPSFVEIEKARSSFIGLIQQIPPQISAIKVNGKRSYALVRAGQEVTLAARTVEIFELTFQALAKDRIGFKVRCSSGTYIRAIARDLGEMLGCGGALESLRREELPPFSVAEAHTLAEIETSHILSVERIFCTDSPSSGVRASVELPAEIVVKLRVGNIPEKIISMLSMYAKADALVLYREHARQEALGVLEFHEQQWRIFCNFG